MSLLYNGLYEGSEQSSGLVLFHRTVGERFWVCWISATLLDYHEPYIPDRDSIARLLIPSSNTRQHERFSRLLLDHGSRLA